MMRSRCAARRVSATQSARVSVGQANRTPLASGSARKVRALAEDPLAAVVAEVDFEHDRGSAGLVGKRAVGGVGAVAPVAGDVEEMVGDKPCAEQVADAVDRELVGDRRFCDLGLEAAPSQ